MVDMLQDKRDLISAICRKYHVSRLFAFGSALRNDLLYAA